MTEGHNGDPSGTPSNDRRLAVTGAACVGVSVAVLLARLVGLMPSSFAVLIVVATTGVGLRAALLRFARGGASPQRARVMTLVSTVGLAISAVTVVASLPHTTRAGGIGTFTTDLIAHVWTLAVLTALATPVRTLGWRAYIGVGLTGFLGLTALARVVGRPVISSLGVQSIFATSVWVPVTELLCQVLPVGLLLLLAARRTMIRPSALDFVLVGSWAGAGFALYEDTQFGRGGVHLLAAFPFSLLFPSEANGRGYSSMLIAGHPVWMGLVGLGLGFSVLYRRRFPPAWIALPVAVAVALLEHAAANSLDIANAGGSSPLLERLIVDVTVHGWLSSILLVAGMVGVLRIERSAIRPDDASQWWRLSPSTARVRAERLAAAQLSSISGTAT